MPFGKPRSDLFIAILMVVIGLLGIAWAGAMNPVRAEGNGEATSTPFANFMTQLAAPTATEGPSPTLKATPVITATDNSSTLNSADALATITAQEAQIKTLQDQLAANQGDNGATLYAVVIIAIGLLLAFAVFFGLKRG